MDKKSIDGKELAKMVEEGLSQGKTKKELFEELSSQYFDAHSIAVLITLFPDATRKKKYEKLNSILKISLIVSCVVHIFAVLMMELSYYHLFILLLLIPLAYITFIIQVPKMKGNTHRMLSFLSLIAILKYFECVFRYGLSSFFYLIYVEVPLLVCIAGLSFYIHKKVFPYLKIMGIKKDENGEYQF